jgi:glycosyltransferase involved in cell wall biosynthesis
MNSQPLVSIIIPAYNRAHLIGETLDSVLAQTYTNWECIVVDDGSSDNTDEVVGAYVNKDTRFKYYHRPEKHLRGGNGARNYGFNMSQGEYIQWFDSDDLMLKHKLEFSIQTALQQEADVVFKKHNPKEKPYSLSTKFDLSKLNVDSFFVNYMLGEYPVITNDVFIRRSIININFDEHLRKAQEFDFFSRLFQQKLTYYFTLEITHYKRQLENSISGHASIGSYPQFKSLVELSKKMVLNYKKYPEIQDKGRHLGKKLYKSYIKRGKINYIIKNFDYFKTIHNLFLPAFIFFFVYNIITRKGFDQIRRYSNK